jgi:hypothetical protein
MAEPKYSKEEENVNAPSDFSGENIPNTALWESNIVP